MVKIVVFDSGFGSLSIITAIQKQTKSDIIYFADQKNFPYGKKSRPELAKLIKKTISELRQKFNPDLIVVGSNTPSLLLEKIFVNEIGLIGVYPPLSDAQRLTKTKSIAILATSSAIKSKSLNNYIKKNINKQIKITKIDATELIDLVEKAQFIHKKNFCMQKINSVLSKTITANNVDVVTLSSTHLPFLLPMLKKIFPYIQFLDPAEKIAQQVMSHKLFFATQRNSLIIFSSGNTKIFQNNLQKIGIKKTIHHLSF